MPDPFPNKSTVDDIRARFDADVARFSNLETGQSATVDAAIAMSLVTEAAAGVTPNATSALDLGCGAGNYTLKLLQRLPGLDVTLVDLSQPMLDAATKRIDEQRGSGGEAKATDEPRITALQGDLRELRFEAETFDIVLAAAVLHHLRSEEEWLAAFANIHRWLRPGGGFWVFDMVSQDHAALEAIMRRRYGQYLSDFKDEAYRDHVFDYIEMEDTPRSLAFQLDMMRRVGFEHTAVLHYNSGFAAFGAWRD